MNEAMNNLASAFNTTFKSEDVEKQIQEIDQRKQNLIKNSRDNNVLKNQQFMEVELKSLIMSSRSILQKLEDDIKTGTHARTYEVYAKLLEAVLKQYQELRELNRMIYDIGKKEQQEATTFNKNNLPDNKISLDASQLLDLVDAARSKNTMNAIHADFIIDESDGK